MAERAAIPDVLKPTAAPVCAGVLPVPVLLGEPLPVSTREVATEVPEVEVVVAVDAKAPVGVGRPLKRAELANVWQLLDEGMRAT